MEQNPIEDILNELHFTKVQKEGFWRFLNYAKICQETGSNKQLKSQLEEVVREIVQNSACHED